MGNGNNDSNNTIHESKLIQKTKQKNDINTYHNFFIYTNIYFVANNY